MKKSNLLVFECTIALVMIMFSCSLVSGALFVSQSGSVYSLGDEVSVSIMLSSDKTTSNYLSLALNCDEQNQEIYRAPVLVKVGDQKKVDFTLSLDNSVIGGLIGNCYLVGKFAGQEARGDLFKISSEIILNSSGLQERYNPGDSLILTGSASKYNGQSLQGSVEIVASGLGVNFVKSVVDGTFNFDINIAKNTKSGNYSIEIGAYDQDYSGNKANSGNLSLSFNVNQVLNELDIALSELNVTPGSNITYSIVALDQADEYMTVDSYISLFDSVGNVINDSVYGSQMKTLVFETNSSPGIWKINAVSGEFNVSKEFRVQEYKHIKYDLAGNILNVINDGNIPYSGPVEIKVGEEVFLRHLDLEVGGHQRYELTGKGQEYDILINDGKGGQVVGRSFLTGKTISLGDINENGVSLISWVWIILILVVGLGTWWYYSRLINKRRYGYSSQSLKSPRINPLTPTRTDVIENGDRERAAIVVLKVRNYSQLAGNQQFASVMSKITEDARAQRAYVSRASDGMSIVFSPTLMGNGELVFVATEFAGNASKELEAYNKKFNTPVDYGIGVNEGEIMVEYRGGNFKYMGVSNTVALARKLAETGKKEALISNNVHSLTRAKIKVERAVNGWKITAMKDNSKYSDFIDKFKQRQTRGN
ncbi:MAG: hypothetical protein AABX66_04395 [Nanoarchaeota archaeon]